MCQSASGKIRTQKWYNSDVFPLVPILDIRKADEINTSGFTFRWLFLTLWSRDCVDVEIAVTVSTHWGVGIIALLPYLRFVFTIPCPESLAIWIDRKLSRKP